MQDAESTINIKEIEFTLTVGHPAECRGMDGKKISEGLLQGILAKQMLSQLSPASGWMKSDLTKLKIPLSEQLDEEIVNISSNSAYPINDFSNNFMAQDIASHIVRKEPEIKDDPAELDRRIAEELKLIGIPVDLMTKEEYESSFGDGVCRISKKELKRLAESAYIVTNSDMVTPELFIQIQRVLNDINLSGHSYLLHQEKRTLREILKESSIDIENTDQYPKWHWRSLDYSSKEKLDQILNTSMMWLSSNICHSQEVHFFVEQDESENSLTCNKLRNVILDNESPNILLSIPEIKLNLKSSDLNVNIIRTNDGEADNNKILDLQLKNDHDTNFISAKKLAINRWTSVLDSAIVHNCRNIVMQIIELEDFVDYDVYPLKEIMMTISFESLLELLEDRKYGTKFDNILFNPNTKHKMTQKIFHKLLLKYQDQIQKNGCYLKEIIYDVKMTAIEFAKQGIRCAILTDSNIDFILGKNDIGNKYKYSINYSLEEDIAATSTACIGSRGIQSKHVEGKLEQVLYTNRSRVLSTYEVELQLISLAIKFSKENVEYEETENNEFINRDKINQFDKKEELIMFSRVSSSYSSTSKDDENADIEANNENDIENNIVKNQATLSMKKYL